MASTAENEDRLPFPFLETVTHFLSKNNNISSYSNSKKVWILKILVISCCSKLGKHIDDNRSFIKIINPDNKSSLRSRSGDVDHVNSSQHPTYSHVIVIMVLFK